MLDKLEAWSDLGHMWQAERGPPTGAPVVVGVAAVIASLNPLQIVAQLVLVHLIVLGQASLLVEVEAQHGEGLAGASLSKAKHVKLPVVLGILRSTQGSELSADPACTDSVGYMWYTLCGVYVVQTLWGIFCTDSVGCVGYRL